MNDNPDEGLAALRAALQSVSRETDPREWARLQVGIGDALLNSSEGILEWTQLQPRAGNPHFKLAQNDLGKIAKEAQHAYLAALEECTPDKDLDLWAKAHAGACDAWVRLGLANFAYGTYSEMFRASKSLRSLLSRFPCERNPLLWATSQHRLACARLAMAVRKDDPDDPEAPLKLANEALEALVAAAEAFLRHGFPQHHRQVLEQIEELRSRIARNERRIRQQLPGGPASS